MSGVIAQAEFVTPNEQQVNVIAPESKYIKTPQTKTKLHDKQRIKTQKNGHYVALDVVILPKLRNILKSWARN